MTPVQGPGPNRFVVAGAFKEGVGFDVHIHVDVLVHMQLQVFEGVLRDTDLWQDVFLMKKEEKKSWSVR